MDPKSGSCLPEAIATSSILQTLAPADAAEAEAFQRRFHALRQKTELPKAGTRAFGKVGKCRKHPEFWKIAGSLLRFTSFLRVGGIRRDVGRTRCMSLMSFHCPVHEDPLWDMDSLPGVY